MSVQLRPPRPLLTNIAARPAVNWKVATFPLAGRLDKPDFRSYTSCMADLNQVKQHAETLIKQHCPTYKFKWGKGIKTLGMCDYFTKTICISKPFAQNNELKYITDTILHEIAHALTPGAGHGERWKRECIRLGCTPKAKSTSTNIKMPYKYTTSCENGCWKAHFLRKVDRRGYICNVCSGQVIVKPFDGK